MNKDQITEMARKAGFAVNEKARQHQPNCIFHTHYMVDELLERFAALVRASERSRQHDEIERLTNLCYEYLGELTALRAVKQTQDMMRDGLTIGSAWVRDGKRLEPTSVYKSMEEDA